MNKMGSTPTSQIRQSGENIKEWWKEVWGWIKQVTVWTCEAIAWLFQTWTNLASASVSKISSNVWEKWEEQLASMQEDRKNNLKQAGTWWRQFLWWAKVIWKWAYHTVKWAFRTAWGVLMWWYHAMDAWEQKYKDRRNIKWKKAA